MKTLKENIKKFELYLSTYENDELNELSLALDRLCGIVNVADPCNFNKNIIFDGELNHHVFRANVKEGWIEQYVPVKIDSENIMYDVKNGQPIIIRKYGKVELAQ